MKIIIFIFFFLIHSSYHASTPADALDVDERQFLDSATFLKVWENTTIHIPCELTNINDASVSWYHNGLKIANTSRILVATLSNVQIESNYSLKIVHTSRGNTGEYVCQGLDSVSNRLWGRKHVIDVLYLPEVEAANMWIQSAIGLQTDLTCHINANPRAKVEWFRGNDRLAVGPKYSIRFEGDTYTLTIKSMKYDDFTNYTCQGANFLGQNSQTIEVSGLAKPPIFKQYPRFRTEKSFTLIWEVDSYSPVIQYNLRFRKQQRGDVDGRWIELIIPAGDETQGPIQTEKYTLTGLEAATVYEASVSAKNEFGWNSYSNVFYFATVGTEAAPSMFGEELNTPLLPISTEFTSDLENLDNKIEENASWFANVGYKQCCIHVPLVIIIVSMRFIL